MILLPGLLVPLSSFSGERPQPESRVSHQQSQLIPQSPPAKATLEARESTDYTLPQHAQWQLENSVPKTTSADAEAAKPKTKRARRERIANGLSKWVIVVTGPVFAKAIQRRLKKKDYWKQIMYTLGILLVGVGLMVASRRYGGSSFGGNNIDWLFQFMWPFGIILVGVAGILLVLAVYYIIREIKKEKEKEREKERARKAAERRKKEAEERRKQQQSQQKDKKEDDRNKQLTPEELKQKQREYLEQKRREEFERRNRETQPPPTTAPPNERQPEPGEQKPLNPPPADPPPNSKDEGAPIEKRTPRRPEPTETPPPMNERRTEPDRK